MKILKTSLKNIPLSLLAGLLVTMVPAQAKNAGWITRTLNNGWQFHSLHTPEASQQVDWRPASVPGAVQADLLRDGLIPDPNYGLNEPKYQWVGLSDWEYRLTFAPNDEEKSRQRLELVFEGLDTFAEVYLNNEPVLNANNMFRTWRIPLTGKLRANNEIRIVFHSPVYALLPKVKALPFKLPSVAKVREGGIATDPYARKAPYQYGWDFNPGLLTIGIWQPVRLEAWNGLRLDDLHIRPRELSKEAAYFDSELTIESDKAAAAEIEISQCDAAASGQSASTVLTMTVQLHPGTNNIRLPGCLKSPRLWWPNGYGPQLMYRFEAQVRMGSDTERMSREIGFRSLELRREKDAWGKSFAFVVNGVPIFAKGASVVPIDVFPSRLAQGPLERMLKDARDANMNMVRCWGGGVYEPDVFYELCDHLGLMVWQDFMFGNEQPDYETEFAENTRQEVIDQVTRLRNHPSIVLWCGNNEVETAWFNWRVKYENSLTPEQRDAVWGGYIHLTDGVIGSTVKTLAPETPYWPSTPSANYDELPDSQHNGDMHFWKVWFANKPYSFYTEAHPRFMSEYGFESFPEMATLRAFAPAEELKLESATMTEHQKSMGAHGNKVIESAVNRDLGKPVDFPALVYLSQVEQAHAVKTGAEDFRRMRPRTMGSLYWELQDGWPDIYSSSIDYYGRWKALQFYARRFYAPLLVSACLNEGKANVYAISDLQQAVKGTVRIRLMDFQGKVLKERTESVEVPPLTSTLAISLDQPEFLRGQDPKTVFAHVEWMQGNKLLAANELYFLPVKYLKLPKANIHWTLSGDGSKLRLTSEVLARDVSVGFEDPDLRLSDNYFDLLPGQTVEIGVEGKASLKGLNPHMMSLTDALSPAEEKM